MNLKQSLHSLLADNETAEVIKQLRSITEESSLTDLNAEVEQILTRFQKNIQESHHELSDEGSINRENASIRYALFAVINKLPEDAVLPEALRARRLKIAVLIVAAVVIFAVVAFNLDWFKLEIPKFGTKTPVVLTVIESSKTVALPVVVPIALSITPVAPINTPRIVVDTRLKVDTLRKKRVKRLRKIATPVTGKTFSVN